MTDYKLVPVEPTAEMVEAAEDAYMPFGDMEMAMRMALLAAPAVQEEAAAWQLRTQDERLLQSAANSLRGYALELMLSHTLENGEWPDGEEGAKAHHDHMRALAKGLEELKAARTEAVQGEPVGRVKTVGGYPDESEHTVEWLCKYKDLKDGDYLYTTPQPAEQQPAPDVAGLVEALEQCITSMLDNGYLANALVIRAARAALAAYRKQGGDV